MSDFAVDNTVFAFLASCVSDFIRWPQCSIASLRGRNKVGCFSDVLFKATAMNYDDRTVFWIVVTKEDDWRVRLIQLSNHVLLDGRDADLDLIVNAVNRFMEAAGMREGESRD